MADRLADTRRFYDLLARLEARIGGKRKLADCNGSMNWPNSGICFFCEDGEVRSSSGKGLRIVWVGTHGVTAGGRSTLWNRLAKYRGPTHRGVILRGLVGIALAQQQDIDLPSSWRLSAGVGAGEAGRPLGLDRDGVKQAEMKLEAKVSCHIRAMPFLWLNVGDEPGSESDRVRIKRNAIALLSGYREPALDPPSGCWLGHSSDDCRVRRSGLWNRQYVEAANYDPSFLDDMERWLARIMREGVDSGRDTRASVWYKRSIYKRLATTEAPA